MKRLCFLRVVRPFSAALFTLALAFGLAFAALTPAARGLEAVLDELSLKTNPTAAEINEAVEKLVAKGPVVVPFLRAAIQHSGLIPSDLRRPRWAMSRIGNPEIELQRRLSDEIPEAALRRLKGALERPIDEDEVFKRYPAAGQGPRNAADNLAAEDVLRALGGTPLLQPVLDAVNHQLTNPALWTPKEIEPLDLSGYAKLLRDRVMLDEDPAVIMPVEWAFLNRRILERLLAPALWPLVDQPRDQVRFSVPVKIAALRALARIDTPEAKEILASHQSAKPDENAELSQALAVSGGLPAAEQVMRLVIRDPGLAGGRSMDFLADRLRRNDVDAQLAVETVMRAHADALERLPADNGWVRALRLADQLPNAEFAVEIVSRSLNQPAPPVNRAAASFVRTHVKYFADEGVRRGFLANGGAGLVREDFLDILRSIGREGVKQALPLLAHYLDSSDRELQNAACDAMAKLSGQAFGRNPAAWRGWLAQQGIQ